ncbi:DUF4391 domain-containing protein [Candidatus Omnitrophota bacterium]
MLPKNKIFEHASPTSAVKKLFVREVEKIIWSYKLSPETINLPAKVGILEIQIFTIILKTGTLKKTKCFRPLIRQYLHPFFLF